MNKIKVLFFALTFSFISIGQEESNLESFGKIGLGFEGLSATYELPIGDRFLFEPQLGLGAGYNVIGNSAENRLELDQLTPFAKARFKYLYNLEKRADKGKNTSHNSGNYVAFQSKYSFGQEDYILINEAMLTEVHWGLQRNLGGNFIFATHIGLGYLSDFDTNNDQLIPTAGLNFSYRVF